MKIGNESGSIRAAVIYARVSAPTQIQSIEVITIAPIRPLKTSSPTRPCELQRIEAF